MDSKVKIFVETFKPKKIINLTIKDWMKSNNHEIWIQCPKCGIYEDLRKTFYCGDCGTQLHPNFK